MLMTAQPLNDIDDTSKQLDQHDDPCHYHDHNNQTEYDPCKARKRQDKSFYASFFREIREEAEASSPMQYNGQTVGEHSVNEAES